ncbi:MAG: hypothetical protein JXR44_01160 [Thiotrichales bacterium]|nr:hypothetical protein [Thiotrichales bacterium]
MQVGLKKRHENEWLVQIGCASIPLDHFSLALLDITLEHLLALERGEQHSTLQSYLKLGLRLKQLSAADLQKGLREVASADISVLLRLAADESLTHAVLQNSGAILARQIQDDLKSPALPSEDEAKAAIRRLMEKVFELEAKGVIEWVNEQTRYI